MHLAPKITYSFQVTARELNLIRRALVSFGGQGDKLASELLKKQGDTIKLLEDNFKAQLEIAVNCGSEEDIK
jgi:hypothetical protein